MTRNECLALLAGAGAAPQRVVLDYANAKDEDAYRRAVDALDALGIQMHATWKYADQETIQVWLGDHRELVLHGPPRVFTQTPIEVLAKRTITPTYVDDGAIVPSPDAA